MQKVDIDHDIPEAHDQLMIELNLPDPTSPPTVTSLASTSSSEIILPWHPTPISLGSGLLLSGSSSSGGSPLLSTLAFSPVSSPQIEFHPTSGSSTTFNSISSTSASASTSHIAASIGVNIGYKSVFSANVTGSYNKSVQENLDSNKYSLQANLRCGSIVFRSLPSLSLPAKALIPRLRLKSNPNVSREKFYNTYGDYFIGGFRLGGDAAVLLSSNSAGSMEAVKKEITVSVKVFGMRKSVSKSEREFKSRYSQEVNLCAFDTLFACYYPLQPASSKGYYKTTELQGNSLLEKGAYAMELVRTLDLRVKRKMQEVGLGGGKRVLNEEECRRICESGLVVELILVPFCRLREWVSVENELY